jgi:hypothetical protein
VQLEGCTAVASGEGVSCTHASAHTTLRGLVQCSVPTAGLTHLANLVVGHTRPTYLDRLLQRLLCDVTQLLGLWADIACGNSNITGILGQALHVAQSACTQRTVSGTCTSQPAASDPAPALHPPTSTMREVSPWYPSRYTWQHQQHMRARSAHDPLVVHNGNPSHSV